MGESAPFRLIDMTIDTIVAQATAPGRGGVGIIRVSGPLAAQVALEVTGKTLKPRYAEYLPFKHQDGNELDQGIALYFPNPHSFTGEDVLELQGHGGPVVMDMLIKRILTIAGVRPARPGEFSERAFLNDKMDLAQAEAIADLIDASSEQAAKSALHSLQGEFSKRIHTLVEWTDAPLLKFFDHMGFGPAKVLSLEKNSSPRPVP